MMKISNRRILACETANDHYKVYVNLFTIKLIDGIVICVKYGSDYHCPFKLNDNRTMITKFRIYDCIMTSQSEFIIDDTCYIADNFGWRTIPDNYIIKSLSSFIYIMKKYYCSQIKRQSN